MFLGVTGSCWWLLSASITDISVTLRLRFRGLGFECLFCDMDWMFVSPPPNSYVENLMPKVMVLGGEGLGEVISSWEQNLHEWDWHSHIKGFPERSLTSSTKWGPSRNLAIFSPGEDLHQNLAAASWPWTSSPWKYILVVYKPSILLCLAVTSWADLVLSITDPLSDFGLAMQPLNASISSSVNVGKW